MSYLEELLPEFRKGAKIRMATWGKNCYIRLGDKNCTEIIDQNNEIYEFSWVGIECSNWELYREPDPDWDYIIKNKCLCWFWDDDEDKPVICAGLIEIASERFSGFRSENGSCWRHCRPVRRDEVTFYEDRNDD